jgi:hypothetical protein
MLEHVMVKKFRLASFSGWKPMECLHVTLGYRIYFSTLRPVRHGLKVSNIQNFKQVFIYLGWLKIKVVNHFTESTINQVNIKFDLRFAL